MLISFINFIIAVVLLALQQILAVRLSAYVGFPDLILVFFVLCIVFGKIENNKWLFLAAFGVGAVMSVWSGRPLGLDSLVYALPAYVFYTLKNHISIGMFLFLVVFLMMFIIKFLLYMFVGIIFRYPALYSFAISITFLYVFAATIVVGLFAYSLLKMVRKIWGKSYAEE